MTTESRGRWTIPVTGPRDPAPRWFSARARQGPRVLGKDRRLEIEPMGKHFDDPSSCAAGFRRALGTFLLLAVLGGAGSLCAQGFFDPAKTPVTQVPSDRWGALQPTKIIGDSSWWNFGQTPNNLHPYWHDVDVENGFVFATS